MVGFIEAVKLGFTRVFDYSGRSSRAEFWWFHLFLIPWITFWGLIGIIISVLTGLPYGNDGPYTGLENFIGVIMWLSSFILLLPLNVRRLHDVGQSGWTYFFLIIPIFGFCYWVYYSLKQGDLFGNAYGPYRDGTSLVEISTSTPTATPIPKQNTKPTSTVASPTICKLCHFENTSGATFCGGCGKPLGDIICTNCQFENPNIASFCEGCGQRLGAS